MLRVPLDNEDPVLGSVSRKT
uniref:Translation initiation factor 1 n=2 Tax=Passiflora edulis TaxID=78168 RepID=A0A8E6B2D3_PASED|nr:translation initiation factor 1 [Passiflora edulis]QVL28926.1 translation initiation factor 1 [Passiflora edulis f. flavicarpa]